MNRFAIAAVLAILTPTLAVADDAPTPASAPADKSAYTLLNPTPPDQLRDLNSDRPSTTIGPFTVDAGHLQVEDSFAQYTKDRSPSTGGDGGEAVSILPGQYRLGLTDRTEIALTVQPYLTQRAPATLAAGPSRPATPAAHTGGFGDLTLQGKLNLFGDDGGDHPGDTAVAVVPYLTLPTASSTKGLGTGRVAGGVALPLQVTLPDDFVLAAMAEFDFPRNDANTRTGFDCLHTVILSHPIVGPLQAFAEYAGTTPVGLGHGYQAQVDTGLTYGVSNDLQFDAAIDIGRSRDTAAFTILAGFTYRR